MTANTKLIQAIAGALVAEHGDETTEWLDGGGRANVARIVAEWGAAIEEGRWIERLEDVLVDAGDESGWKPVADGPVFRYVRVLREDGAEGTIPPDLRLCTLYTVELVCAPGRSEVLVEEGLRGRLADVASKAVESARVSERWRVDPGEPIFVWRMRYDLDEWSDLPVPEGYRMDPFRDSR